MNSGEKQRLTLQEAKDKVAKKYGYKDFKEIAWYLTHVWSEKGWETYMAYFDEAAELYASQSLPIQNPDKEHFDKKLLNELVWKLDREIWAHVENPNPSEPWTQSKAREESRKLIAEYIGDFDSFCLNLAPPIIQRNGCEIQCKECRTEIDKHQVPIREKPDWISVKERLPEPETPVLVTWLFPVGNTDIGISFTTNKFPDTFDHVYFDIVTHWQPLPSAPGKDYVEPIR
jgi:hypothetical protein